MGAGVAGDPAAGVGGDRGPVQRRALDRGQGLAEQDREQGVAEQGPAGQRIGFAAEVEGVEVDPGGTQGQGGAADGVGQALVFAVGVDDQDLHALVQPAQRLQLGQIAHTGPRTGQDDLVVVRLGPPVPTHQPPGGRVAADQHPPTAGRQRQVGGSEREASVVREAPRLDQDTELSEEDEARLYAHYGIQYTTEESSSGLPVGVTASGDGGPAADATTELPPSSRLEADLPAASTLPGTARTTATPAATSWSDATTSTDADNAGEPKGGRGKKAAAAGGQAARKAVQAGQQAAASGRVAAHKASREVAAVVAAIETTPESKHKARKRARARKRVMAAAAGAARSVVAALGVTWRRVRKSDVG